MEILSEQVQSCICCGEFSQFICSFLLNLRGVLTLVSCPVVVVNVEVYFSVFETVLRECLTSLILYRYFCSGRWLFLSYVLGQGWPTSRSPSVSWSIAPDLALNWQDTWKEHFSINTPFYCILWHFLLVTLLPTATGRSRSIKKLSSRSQSMISWPPLS